MEVGLTVILYDKNATTFTGNGICVLSPAQCSVAEVAGGKYELHMEHPYDEYGKYSLLAEDYLIKAPVPPVSLPAITLPELKVLKTNKQTSLYSKLPVTKYPAGEDVRIKNVRDNAAAFAWTLTKYYNYGEYAVLGGVIYKAKQFNFQVAPINDSSIWATVGLVSGESATPTYDPGTVEETLSANETVSKLGDYSSGWIRVRSIRGKSGYVKRDDVDETTQTEQITIPAQTITEQVFRIYQVEGDDERRMISVDAKHISYDFKGNALYDCVFSEAEPMDAIAILQGALMIQDGRTIACDITGKKVSGDWSFKNPINALLDPGDGLLAAVDGNLIRNNADFYILGAGRTGIKIKYGVNMLGVRWKRNNENRVSRIVPRCNNGSEGYIYLEDMYVDSPNAASFPFPRIEVMDCQYAVGEEYETPDGTKVKRTEESCREAMLADAQKRFAEDHVDGVDVSLDVQFLLLGDTEEYAQYRGLQTVCMYDSVTVETDGIEATARVTEYQWDCLAMRYNTVSIGTVDSFTRRVPGYKVVKQSITYDKLSPDLINRIRTANASGSTDGGASGGHASGDGISVLQVEDSLTSSSTDKALSAKQGKVISDALLAGTAVTDLDNAVPASGQLMRFYTFASTATNKPWTQSAGGAVLVMGGSTTYYTQIAVWNTTGDARMYMRAHSENGYSSWAQV